jgi:hypothetical protein
MAQPLMPKATAVWLIEKTSLTFEQVAEFVGMHPLEVQAIADGEVAQGIIGTIPVLNGQLTREEIARCEADSSRALNCFTAPSRPEGRKGARYTPFEAERPAEGIAWLLRNHPQLTANAGGQALGPPPRTPSPRCATAPIGKSARTSSARPGDLGRVTQSDLNAAVAAAGERARGRQPPPPPPRRRRKPRPDEAGGLAPAAPGASAFAAQAFDLFLQPQLFDLEAGQFGGCRGRAGVFCAICRSGRHGVFCWSEASRDGAIRASPPRASVSRRGVRCADGRTSYGPPTFSAAPIMLGTLFRLAR